MSLIYILRRKKLLFIIIIIFCVKCFIKKKQILLKESTESTHQNKFYFKSQTKIKQINKMKQLL